MHNVGKDDHTSENDNKTDISSVVPETVITSQGDFDIDKKNVGIARKIVENHKK